MKMKKYCKMHSIQKWIVHLSVIMLILFPSIVLAQTPAARALKGYFAMGGGGGGDARSSNIRAEGGAYTTTQSVNILFGLGTPFTLERNDTPSNLYNYPCPHSDFTDLGNKKKGEEFGVYGKFGMEPIKNTGFFIFGTGGCTWGEEIQLTQSNITRRYYTESKTTKTYGLFGGGIGYFPMQGHFTAQVQYDNRMGITGSLGFAW